MNNNRLNHLYVLHVLIPPTPFSCRQKKGECSVLPLFAMQRGGWGEFMLLNNWYLAILNNLLLKTDLSFHDSFFFKFFFRFFLSYVSFIYLYCYNLWSQISNKLKKVHEKVFCDIPFNCFSAYYGKWSVYKHRCWPGV